MTVFEMIEAQQKGCENEPAFFVGEQLKEICAADPDCAAIVAEDLQNESMSIHRAEERIKSRADEIRKQIKGRCVCIPPNVAEEIIREFYGLPAATAKLRRVENQAPENLLQDDELGSIFDLF